MKLVAMNIEIFASRQEEKVTKAEIQAIQKKNGNKALKICFPILSVIMLIVIVYSLIWGDEFPLFYLLFFGCLCLPMTIGMLREPEPIACYGVVTAKNERCAKLSGKGNLYMPFEKTEKIGTYRHKYTLFQTVGEFYYCSVEINGQVYENVCCYRKDYPHIEIGDSVILANEGGYYNTPVVYAASK